MPRLERILYQEDLRPPQRLMPQVEDARPELPPPRQETPAVPPRAEVLQRADSSPPKRRKRRKRAEMYISAEEYSQGLRFVAELAAASHVAAMRRRNIEENGAIYGVRRRYKDRWQPEEADDEPPGNSIIWVAQQTGRE